MGVGNPDRGDDAAGWECVHLLQEAAPRGVSLHCVSGEASRLLDAFQTAERVWLVDAVQSGSPPGTLHILDALRAPLPAEWFAPVSTHGFGVAEAIELARSLGRLPIELHVIGIEAGAFDAGAPLSPRVLSAVHEAVDHLLAILPQEPPHA